MIQAMYSGISGMRAFKQSLDVIGNNIANINTTGFKGGRATFKEMLCQTMAGASGPTGNRGGVNANQIGLGVLMGSIDQNMNQGSMQSTGRSTDLAIEGNGFFALGNGGSIMYSRDGSFTLDADFNLVSSSSGMKVLGWPADVNTGELDTSAAVTGDTGIKIPVGGLSIARQTTGINVGGNLNAASATNFSYPIKFDIYDSLGLTHEVRVVFTKTANPAEWAYEVHCPDVDNAAPVQSGTIAFDNQGFSTLDSIDLSLTMATPNGSVTPLDCSIDTRSISQLNGANTVDLTYQDGLPLGTLESFSIDRSGMVVGTFTNGTTRTLGQVAMVGFNNPAGLIKQGSNLMVESPNSGVAKIGIPGTGGLGMITPGFLEASNVDLANEFANMIIAQRGFQANTRIMTTADEVLQELVNMKR